MTHASTPTSLSDTDVRRIIQIAAVEAGLAIPEAKKSLVQSRVARRMRQLGISSCSDYFSALEGNADETKQLISALTTNVSHFFRERHHFDMLRDLIKRETPSRLRFWSAGCSNGQEPYSLAIEILKTIPDADRRDILVLASDIDHVVLEKASDGRYSDMEIEGVPEPDRRKFFRRTSDGEHLVEDVVKRLVRFRHLNLNAPSWPMKGPFDAILCRNVVIYFNEQTQSELWPRFHALLKPGGFLMLGHSERIHPLVGSGFDAVGVTSYQKVSS